jgi:hypothetical protein
MMGGGAVVMFFGWLAVMFWQSGDNKRKAPHLISVRQRNGQGICASKVMLKTDATHVTLKDNEGIEKAIVIAEYAPYQVWWPSKSPKFAQTLIDEIEIGAKSFKPIAENSDNPYEYAIMLYRIIADASVKKMMMAYQEWADGEKKAAAINPTVMFGVLVFILLVAIGGLAYQYYNQSMMLKQLVSLYDAMKSSGLIK